MAVKAIQHDDLERDVIFNYPPQRIVSLCPSITETIFALDAGKRLVGKTEFCIHPRHLVDSISNVGGTKNVDMAKIKALNPDLIIAEKEENTRSKVDKLEVDFPVFVFDVENFNGALKMIMKLGELLNREEQSHKMFNQIRQRFVEKNSLQIKKNAVYLIWDKPLMAAGKETYINSMMEMAGFQNIFKGGEARYPKTSIAELESKKPEYILLSSEPYPYAEKEMKWYAKKFPAAEIRLVDGEMFSWYGARMLKAANYFEELKKTLLL